MTKKIGGPAFAPLFRLKNYPTGGILSYGEEKSSGSSPPEAKETRTRSWTFVLYDDSAPKDWRDRLDEYHIPWAESPLHDQDENADGTPKKHIVTLGSSSTG